MLRNTRGKKLNVCFNNLLIKLLYYTVTGIRKYLFVVHTLHKKMKFSIKDFFTHCDQILRKLPICSHLLKKFLMENFIFCSVILCPSCDAVQMKWGYSLQVLINTILWLQNQSVTSFVSQSFHKNNLLSSSSPLSTFFKEDLHRRILDPVRHLRWRFYAKIITS